MNDMKENVNSNIKDNIIIIDENYLIVLMSILRKHLKWGLNDTKENLWLKRKIKSFKKVEELEKDIWKVEIEINNSEIKAVIYLDEEENEDNDYENDESVNDDSVNDDSVNDESNNICEILLAKKEDEIKKDVTFKDFSGLIKVMELNSGYGFVEKKDKFKITYAFFEEKINKIMSEIGERKEFNKGVFKKRERYWIVGIEDKGEWIRVDSELYGCW